MKVRLFLATILIFMSIAAMQELAQKDKLDTSYKQLMLPATQNALNSIKIYKGGNDSRKVVFNFSKHSYVVGDQSAFELVHKIKNGDPELPGYYLGKDDFLGCVKDLKGKSIIFKMADKNKLKNVEWKKKSVYFRDSVYPFLGAVFKGMIAYANTNQVFLIRNNLFQEIKRDNALIRDGIDVVDAYADIAFAQDGNGLFVKYAEEYARAFGIDQIQIIQLNKILF